MQIHLKALKFNAYHGLHTGEDILGVQFEVTLSVTYVPKNKIVVLHNAYHGDTFGSMSVSAMSSSVLVRMSVSILVVVVVVVVVGQCNIWCTH